MINADKSVERVVTRSKAKKAGDTHARITNEELLGVRPNGVLEEAGVDLMAGTRRNEIEYELENTHGLGLVPDNHDGVWKIVTIDEKGAHILLHRMRRLERLIHERANGSPSTLRSTVEEYQTNPHSSADFCKVLAKAERSMMALEIVASEVIHPHIERLERLLVPFKSGDDE